ncbi:hypothetical protein CDAR_555441 [Caerostris darwini]|uniref:Uncharacterized protein n=1 Tax=Caerostris darwini TaxID=1538125 RepID=A0AAV4Q9I1_9ARAC|nr:hypothetical protein CDAR_555441 [Caerostris darwini]
MILLQMRSLNGPIEETHNQDAFGSESNNKMESLNGPIEETRDQEASRQRDYSAHVTPVVTAKPFEAALDLSKEGVVALRV